MAVFIENMATFGSQRKFYTQASNDWIFWMSIGMTISFFALTEIGQKIVREGTKAAVKRIPPGEEWGLPGFLDRGPREPRVEIPRGVRQPEEMRETEVLWEALPKVAQKLVECLPDDIKAKYAAYYQSDPNYVLAQLNNCLMRTDVGIIPGKMPTAFGEVGWIGRHNPDPMVSEVRLVGFGTPSTRKEIVITLKGISDWIASPQNIPLYKAVR